MMCNDVFGCDPAVGERNVMERCESVSLGGLWRGAF